MQLYEVIPVSIEQLNKQIALFDRWLANSAVFSDGAIAGSIDESGCALYTYPEISGYYLSYLAYRFRSDGACEYLVEKAQKILGCQEKMWSEPSPPVTRLYLNEVLQSQADWRNQGLFIFDIAMLARGVADMSLCINTTSWPIQNLLHYIDDFWDGYRLNPVRWFAGRPEGAPDRWSTRTGAYQLKVIAALQQAAITWNNSILLEKIALVQMALLRDFNQGDFATHNPHSIAYALEGALLLGNLDDVNQNLGKMLIENLASSIDHSAQDEIDFRRTDAIAQLLRLSCCEPFFNRSIADRLYQLLCSALNTDGSIQFALAPCNVTYKNTWPVLFARQALDFYRRVCLTGEAVSIKEARCLF
jgi:hypothetical protein